VMLVELAHGRNNFVGSGCGLDRLGDFIPDVGAQGVGGIEFLIVSAGVNGGQNREERFAGLEGNRGVTLRPSAGRQQQGKAHNRRR
jgi:hypothetical protein